MGYQSAFAFDLLARIPFVVSCLILILHGGQRVVWTDRPMLGGVAQADQLAATLCYFLILYIWLCTVFWLAKNIIIHAKDGVNSRSGGQIVSLLVMLTPFFTPQAATIWVVHSENLLLLHTDLAKWGNNAVVSSKEDVLWSWRCSRVLTCSIIRDPEAISILGKTSGFFFGALDLELNPVVSVAKISDGVYSVVTRFSFYSPG